MHILVVCGTRYIASHAVSIDVNQSSTSNQFIVDLYHWNYWN